MDVVKIEVVMLLHRSKKFHYADRNVVMESSKSLMLRRFKTMLLKFTVCNCNYCTISATFGRILPYTATIIQNHGSIKMEPKLLVFDISPL